MDSRPRVASSASPSTALDSQAPAVASLLSSVLKYVPGSLVPAVVGVVTTGVFTRIFTSEEYGRFSLIISVAGLISALLSHWLQQGISRYIPGEQNVRTIEALKGAVATSLIMLTAILALISIFTIWGLEKVSGGEWNDLLWPAGVLVWVTAMYTSLLAVMQADMRAGRYSLYTLLSTLLRLGLSLILVLLVRRSPAGLAWATALSQLLLLPAMWRDSRLPNRAWLLDKGKTVMPTIGRLAVYGLPLTGWFLAATLLNVGDRYVIQALRGASEVGIYSANYSLVYGSAGLISAPILLAAHPFLMRAWGEGKPKVAGQWLGKIVEWYVTIGILLVGGVSLFARDVAQLLLGPEFRQGYLVMPVVVAGVIVWQIGLYTHKPLEFTGRTKLMLWLGIAAAISNVGLNFVFVPMFGYVAAAYTTVFSYMLYVATTIWAGRTVLQWSVRWKVLLTPLVISVGCFAAAAIGRPKIELHFGYVPGLASSVVMALVAAVAALFRVGSPMIRQLFARRT